MNNSVVYLNKQLELQTRLFQNVTDGLNLKMQKRANNNVNHIGWPTGHLVSSRFFFANLIGIEENEPFPELFGQGKGLDILQDYPELDKQINAWNSISKIIMLKFQDIDEKHLSSDAPIPVPTGNKMGDMLTFLIRHEGYHLGQLGILRKYFGFDSMRYN